MKPKYHYYFKLIIILFLVSCGSQRNHNYDYLFHEYEPSNIKEIKNALNLNHPVLFYVGNDEDVQKVCGEHEKHVNACIFTDERKVFISYELKDWCQILVHELTHQELYDQTGNADSDHESEKFSVVTISNLCLSMNLFP